MTRSKPIAIAAILTAVYSVYILISLFAAILGDNNMIETIGLGNVGMSLMVFSMALVSAYGVWQNQKWGKIIAIICLTLNGLTALPGILFASTFLERLEPLLGVLVAVIVIVLLLRRADPVLSM